MTQLKKTARYPDGVGIGIERTRCYLAHDVASGSARTIERVIADYVGQDDLCRIWLKDAKKQVLWEHTGPLTTAPDLFDVLTIEVQDSADEFGENEYDETIPLAA